MDSNLNLVDEIFPPDPNLSEQKAERILSDEAKTHSIDLSQDPDESDTVIVRRALIKRSLSGDGDDELVDPVTGAKVVSYDNDGINIYRVERQNTTQIDSIEED